MTEKLKVGVLYDADLPELRKEAQAKGESMPFVHDQAADALTRRGHQVTLIPVDKKIRSLVTRLEKDESDVWLNLCESVAHRTQNEPCVAGVLELLEKPFTGAGALGMMLAQDKGLAKKIFQFHQLPYPRFSTIDAGHVEWADDLSFPLIVKPLNEDASIGISDRSVVHNVRELLERIGHLHTQLHAPALVEEFIEGREIYVGVLGNGRPEVFPVLEWDLSKVKDGPRIASAEAKWDKESEGYQAPQVFPEDIPAEVVKRMQEAAIGAFQALKLRDYARVDLRLRRREQGASKNADDWEFFIIEMNPNPWLERRSEFAMAARKHGLSYPDLLERILELAIQRYRGAAKPPRKE